MDVEGYNVVLKALLTQERDSPETMVDIEAAKLVAQKLGENGVKCETRITLMPNTSTTSTLNSTFTFELSLA